MYYPIRIMGNGIIPGGPPRLAPDIEVKKVPMTYIQRLLTIPTLRPELSLDSGSFVELTRSNYQSILKSYVVKTPSDEQVKETPAVKVDIVQPAKEVKPTNAVNVQEESKVDKKSNASNQIQRFTKKGNPDPEGLFDANGNKIFNDDGTPIK